MEDIREILGIKIVIRIVTVALEEKKVIDLDLCHHLPITKNPIINMMILLQPHEIAVINLPTQLHHHQQHPGLTIK